MLQRPTISRHAVYALMIGALVAAGGTASAALIEYLPLAGDVNAPVGTGGVAVHGPTYVANSAGQPNAAIAFAPGGGSGSYVSIAGGGGLSGLSTGTIAFWAEWNGTQPAAGCCGGTFGTITARQSNGVFSNDVITLDNANPNLAHIDVRMDSAGGNTLTSSTLVGDGVWHFIAVSFAPGSQSLYVDGALVGSATGSPNISGSATTPLTLGGWIGDGNSYSNSSMSQFQVYNTALTQQQIQALTPEPSSLILCGVGAIGLLLMARRRRV